MGRNKIKIEKIANDRNRQVTFYKRKRGLLKKAMEIALLCEVKVMMCIVDKNEKVILYSSEDARSFLKKYVFESVENKNYFSTDKVVTLLKGKRSKRKHDHNKNVDEEKTEEPIVNIKPTFMKKKSKFFKQAEDIPNSEYSSKSKLFNLSDDFRNKSLDPSIISLNNSSFELGSQQGLFQPHDKNYLTDISIKLINSNKTLSESSSLREASISSKIESGSKKIDTRNNTERENTIDTSNIADSRKNSFLFFSPIIKTKATSNDSFNSSFLLEDNCLIPEKNANDVRESLFKGETNNDVMNNNLNNTYNSLMNNYNNMIMNQNLHSYVNMMNNNPNLNVMNYPTSYSYNPNNNYDRFNPLYPQNNNMAYLHLLNKLALQNSGQMNRQNAAPNYCFNDTFLNKKTTRQETPSEGNPISYEAYLELLKKKILGSVNLNNNQVPKPVDNSLESLEEFIIKKS